MPTKPASLESLLDQRGSYRLTPVSTAAKVYCDLDVDGHWAGLRVGPTATADGAPTGLEAAGFLPPDPDGRSPSTHAWFRSWAFRTPADRAIAAAEILAAARAAFHLPPDAPLDIAGGPGRRGDPGRPIVVVLLALYAGYALVIGWLVLVAWDILVPTRAHPESALWVQVVAPFVGLVAILGYAVVAPELRLRWVAAHRPPTAVEVDRQMPLTQFLGFLAPPTVFIMLLIATSTQRAQ
jgi:hypothetical protein